MLRRLRGKYKQTTYNQNFTDMASYNGEIKSGKWIDLLEPNMTLLDLKEAISEKYFLDDDIASRLVLQFKVPGGQDGKPKNEYIHQDGSVLPSQERVRSGAMKLFVK